MCVYIYIPRVNNIINFSTRQIYYVANSEQYRDATVATKSGDSSVVTRWAVDQEVAVSNSTHGGNLVSVVRSLSGFTQLIR